MVKMYVFWLFFSHLWKDNPFIKIKDETFSLWAVRYGELKVPESEIRTKI